MHLGVVLRYPALKLCGNFTKLYYTEIAAGPRALHNFSFRFCSLSTSKHVLSRALELLHEEVKSQRDDLKDMCHVIRIKEREVHSAKSSGSLQNESHKTHSIDEQKMQKILSELKAYSIRLSTLQAQAHTLHEDIDSMLSADVSQKEMVEAENFSIDSPYGSITSEHTTENNSTEVIDETDVLLEAPRSDLEGEVGTEPITTIIDETQDMSITEVTQYLHENEVDFSDCFDAAALRQRYAEVKAGTWVDPKKERKRREMEERRVQERDAGYTPHPTQWDGKRSEGTRQERMNYGGSTEQGIIHDPYPGAERKMVDPMKFVWELKADFGRQKNFDPSRVDLWVGTTCLEDHKRLYEYPQLQGNPIEMRLKGDVPKSSPTFPGFNQK